MTSSPSRWVSSRPRLPATHPSRHEASAGRGRGIDFDVDREGSPTVGQPAAASRGDDVTHRRLGDSGPSSVWGRRNALSFPPRDRAARHRQHQQGCNADLPVGKRAHLISLTSRQAAMSEIFHRYKRSSCTTTITLRAGNRRVNRARRRWCRGSTSRWVLLCSRPPGIPRARAPQSATHSGRRRRGSRRPWPPTHRPG